MTPGNWCPGSRTMPEPETRWTARLWHGSSKRPDCSVLTRWHGSGSWIKRAGHWRRSVGPATCRCRRRCWSRSSPTGLSESSKPVQQLAGEVLVVTLPFRYQFPDERAARRCGGRQPASHDSRSPKSRSHVQSTAGVFWPLRRALAISLAAALALLAAMTMFALQLRHYVRAKQAEEQLAIARPVQQDLLPLECSGCEGIEFAVTFLPFSEVGGDYYDVFRVSHHEVALVLGDVAGKGLPAALLMGVVHGAVRGASTEGSGADHAGLAEHLNEILSSRTAGNRYVTLFWGSVDTSGHTLRYRECRTRAAPAGAAHTGRWCRGGAARDGRAGCGAAAGSLIPRRRNTLRRR